MRKILTLAAAAATLAGFAVLAAPASAADPVTTYTTSHGRLVQTVFNPLNRAQSVQVAVDMHFGYVGPVDSTADYVSPVGRVSKVAGAVRVEVDRLRTGADDASFVQDDYRISGNAAARDNGLTPAAPLNSGTASQALGYGDWRAVPKCDGRPVAVRADFSVRWSAGNVSRPSLRGNYVQPNPTTCGPADTSIHAASPFLPLDSAAYTGPDTPQVTSPRSRIVNATTADLVRVASDPASAGGTSVESSDLGVTLHAGDMLSADYAVLDGASTASGAVRLFAYCGENTSTPGHRPAAAPDYVATAPAGATAGTLTVTAAGDCTVGYAGVVYDASNDSTGRVRFTGLQLNDRPVSFL